MVACLCFGVILILVNIYQLRSLNVGQSVGDPEFGSSSRPIVWMNAKNVREPGHYESLKFTTKFSLFLIRENV